ncbi:MAG: iron ABC transporter permease, partial [Rhodospirillaceae bacterium]|nr:iron ABC transporter permease [Rhodospirillaceae bacterium]
TREEVRVASGDRTGALALNGAGAVAAETPPRLWRNAGTRRNYALPLLLAVLLFVLTVIPVLTVVVSSFRPSGLPLSDGWTLEHFARVWSSGYTYRLVLNTFIFAAGSTFVGIALSGVLAWLVERTDMPGRDLFRAGILMPMATPPLLLAIGWVLLMSPSIGLIPSLLEPVIGAWAKSLTIYNLPGMIFVQGLAYVPTAFLILAPAMRNMDPVFEEAARTAGAGFLATLRRVSFPFLVPPLLSVATLLMIVGMLTFDVPAVIGQRGNVNVMSSEIFNLMNPANGLPEYGAIAALNSTLFVLLAFGLYAYYRLTHQGERFATISGKGYKAARFKLGRWRGPAAAFAGFYFALAVVLPFLALLWTSLVPYFAGFQTKLLSQLSLKAYLTLFERPRLWEGALNSTIVATVAALATTALALFVAWTIVRSRLRWVRLLDVMSMIPISIPFLMMGVALVFIFFGLRAIPIYGTVWIIALGHLIVFLPLAARMMQAGVLQVHRELEEAASVSGATLMQNLRRVVVPLLKPTIFALLIWLVVHSLREFSVAVMLISRDNEVLSTILYSLWDQGEPGMAAAIAVLLMLILGGLVAVLSWLTRYNRDR